MSSQRLRWSPSNKRASRARSLHVSSLRERPRVTDRSTRSRDVRAPYEPRGRESHITGTSGENYEAARLPSATCRCIPALPLAHPAPNRSCACPCHTLARRPSGGRLGATSTAPRPQPHRHLPPDTRHRTDTVTDARSPRIALGSGPICCRGADVAIQTTFVETRREVAERSDAGH